MQMPTEWPSALFHRSRNAAADVSCLPLRSTPLPKATDTLFVATIVPSANENQGVKHKLTHLIEIARPRTSPWSSSACRLSKPSLPQSDETLTASQRQHIQSDGKDASCNCSAECGREWQGRAGIDCGDHAIYYLLSQSGLLSRVNIDDTRLTDEGPNIGKSQPHRDFDDLRRIRLRRLPALRNTLSDLGRQIDRWRILVRACHAVFANLHSDQINRIEEQPTTACVVQPCEISGRLGFTEILTRSTITNAHITSKSGSGLRAD